jgi:Core-2/I-Branching enzyme
MTTPTISKKNKIAFLFAIYDTILHEDRWVDFFNGNKDRYIVLIHSKYKPAKLDHFKTIDKTIPSNYGDIGLTHIFLHLFHLALQDDCVDRIVTLSGSCIPIKSFNHIYTSARSTLNISTISQCKSSCWFILDRVHVEHILKNKQLVEKFQHIYGPEEWFFATLLHQKPEIVKTLNESSGATTFTNWYDMTSYPSCWKQQESSSIRPKSYSIITREELLYLQSEPCLFARKFERHCIVDDMTIGQSRFRFL